MPSSGQRLSESRTPTTWHSSGRVPSRRPRRRSPHSRQCRKVGAQSRHRKYSNSVRPQTAVSLQHSLSYLVCHLCKQYYCIAQAIRMDLMPSPPEAGVVALLLRLRTHVCHDVRSDFRQILPVYERLLSPVRGLFSSFFLSLSVGLLTLCSAL
jgi:hypothetical protein